MGNSIYQDRYHAQQSQNLSQNQTTTQATQPQVEGYLQNGDLPSQEAPSSTEGNLTQTQQALSDRYQEARSKIGDTLEAFEDRIKSVKNSKDSTDSKLVALDEIELLLGELESQKTLYHALEDNLSREGLQLDTQNLDQVIDRYQQNIDGYQAHLQEVKKVEAAEAAAAAAAAQAQADQEAALAAQEAQAEQRKIDASNALNSYVGYLNGNLSPRYSGNKSVNQTQAEAILYAMANAAKSGDWSHVKSQISSIEDKYRGTSVALIIAILKYQAPQSVIEAIPPELFYEMSESIQSSEKPEKKRVSGAPQSHTNSGYAAIALELAGISEAYLNSPPPPASANTVPSEYVIDTNVLLHE